MFRKITGLFASVKNMVAVVLAAVVGAILAVIWALLERRGRRRAEAALEVNSKLGKIRLRQNQEISQAEQEAFKRRAAIEAELAVVEVRARHEKAEAEKKLEEIHAEYEATGAVTVESQRLFDEMKKSGRLP